MAPWMIREYDTLKDAVREAYRLARCHFRNTTFSDEFIVANNTGITLNSPTANEVIRYSVVNCIICDNIFSWIHVYWGKHSFSVKVGH